MRLATTISKTTTFRGLDIVVMVSSRLTPNLTEKNQYEYIYICIWFMYRYYFTIYFHKEDYEDTVKYNQFSGERK